MKIKKRALSLLLSLAMVLTFIPVLSFEAFADTQNWVEWDDRYDVDVDGAVTWHAYAESSEETLRLNGGRWIEVYYELRGFSDDNGWEYLEADSVSYQWYKGDSILSGETDYEYYAREGGTYKCAVTLTYGEDTKTESVEIKVNPVKKGTLSVNASNQAVVGGIYYELKPTTTSPYQLISSNSDEEIVIYEAYEEEDGTYYDDRYYIYGSRKIILNANQSYYLYSYSDTTVSISPVQMTALTAGAANQAVKFDEYYILKTAKSGDYTFKMSSSADNYDVACDVMDENCNDILYLYAYKSNYDSKEESEARECILKANKTYYVHVRGSSTNNTATISIENGEISKARDVAESEATKAKQDLATANANLATANANLATANANYNSLKSSSDTTSEELKAAKADLEKANNQVNSLKAKARITKGFKAKAIKKGRVALSWKKTAGANGYQIYRSTKKTSGFKKVATVKKVGTKKWTDKKSKKGKTYYYKIRPYNKVAGKTVAGKWSSVVKVKTKKK